MVTTRPEHEAAQDEYESFLAQSGLSRGDLQHIALEEVDFLDSFTAADVSGVLIGASPYNADTPAAEKTRSQRNVEEQIRELLGVVLKEGIPLLATGVALQVLADYLGTGTQEEFGEELGAVDLFLTAEGREDPVLEGLPQVVTVFAGHYEGVGEVPAHATLLARSPDCQFNPELDAVRFERRVSIYDEAGYGDPDMSEDILTQARSAEAHDAGQIIRNFVSYFARD